jgi:hypothetical protein
MLHAGSMIEGFCGVVFTDNNGKIVGWINEDLVAADAEDRFHRDGSAMMN